MEKENLTDENQEELTSGKTLGAFHGGCSWEFSGMNLSKRETMVIADVLDAPFPPSPKALSVLSKANLESVCKESPPTNAEPLISVISKTRKVPEEDLLVSSGSSSLLFSVLPRLLPSKARTLLLKPTYSEYPHILENVIDCSFIDSIGVDPFAFGNGQHILPVLTDKIVSGKYDAVFLVNPNSPTGTVFAQKDLEELVLKMALYTPQTILWIDECYIDYATIADPTRAKSMEPSIGMNRNLFVCKSLSKSLALSGLRVAYLVGQRCRDLKRWIPPWSVSLPGQIVAMAALQDSKYYANCYRKVASARKMLIDRLRFEGFEVTDGVANFVCVHRASQEKEAAQLVKLCREEHGVFLRCIDASTIRIAVRLQECEIEKIVCALCAVTGRREIADLSSYCFNHITSQATAPECILMSFTPVLWVGALLTCHTDETKYFATGLVVSPTFMTALILTQKLKKHNNSKHQPLLLHQLFATIIWSFVLLMGSGVEDRPSEFRFLGFTLGVFVSELAVLRGGDNATWLHHICAVGLIGMLLVFAFIDDRVNLIGIIRFCALACPSYSCVPKICRSLKLLPEDKISKIWCAALLMWVFGRCAVLQPRYGFGFHRLARMTIPWWEHTYLFSPSYYSAILATALLFAVYIINCFWVYKKLQKVQTYVPKHIFPRAFKNVVEMKKTFSL